MAKNNNPISSENITEWLSSTGFLLPRNELELQRFEKLYSDQDFGIKGDEIDPKKIMDGTYRKTVIKKLSQDIIPDESSVYRMAARKGDAIPKHILEKMLKNQKEGINDPPKQEKPD